MNNKARETPGCGGDMYLRHDLEPEIRLLSSEVFNRSWQFIERDPVLAGEDRQGMQEQLAQHILLLMSSGERNLIVIANRAIGSLRQEYAKRRERLLVDEAA
jgi:hypothetical protein